MRPGTAFGSILSQMAFLRHCAASGYAVLDGDTLRLTPSGMIVQNAILEELI